MSLTGALPTPTSTFRAAGIPPEATFAAIHDRCSASGRSRPKAVVWRRRAVRCAIAQDHRKPKDRALSAIPHLLPNEKMVFQSFFMSTIVQPFAWARSEERRVGK